MLRESREQMLEQSLQWLSQMETEYENDETFLEDLKVVRFLLDNLEKSQKVVCEANRIDDELKNKYGSSITITDLYNAFINSLTLENHAAPRVFRILTDEDKECYEAWLENKTNKEKNLSTVQDTKDALRPVYEKKIISAFEKSKEEVKKDGYSSYKTCAVYIWLDASDIFERVSDEYPKMLIDSCIELCMRRDGYTKTADEYQMMSINEGV
jgi:hypothetical protein